MATQTYTPKVHDVWNTLDEYGLLLGIPRIPGEDNRTYLKRLESAVSAQRGSSLQALVNTISAMLGLSSYTVTGQRHFQLSYKPVVSKDDGTPLSITVTIDGVGQTQLDESTWDSATDGFIIWKEWDGTYSQMLEFKKVPADGSTIIVQYWTYTNYDYAEVVDTFTGVDAQTPGNNQIEIYEVSDPGFIAQYTDANGNLQDPYLRLLLDINALYKRTWGEFKWDRFYWDDGTKLNVLKSYYDGPTLTDTSAYENGVGYGGALKMVGINENGEALILPGYFFLKGKEYYLFANKHYLVLDPNDYGGSLANIPLTITYRDEFDNEISENIHPRWGAPIVVTRPVNYNMLIIGYGGHKLVDINDPGLRKIYDHEYFSFDIVGDDIAECYQYITRDTSGTYFEPTPTKLRKRTAAPTEVILPSDNDYFIITPGSKQTLITINTNYTSNTHLVEMEIGGDVHAVSGLKGPVLDNNEYSIAGTYLGIGSLVPIDVLRVYASRDSVKLNQTFGISVEVIDIEGARMGGVEIIIDPPSGVTIQMENTGSQDGELGHTYNDGTLYGRLKIIDPGTVTAGSTIQFTVRARVVTTASWDSEYNLTAINTNGNEKTFEWTQTLEIRYDG